MSKYEIAFEDLTNMIVCTDLPEGEAIARGEQEPCGTKNGWTHQGEAIADGEGCLEHSGNKHYLFQC